jgi:hypothetical protein
MKKKILIGLGVVGLALAAFAIVVALQPSDFRVTRSAAMASPPAAVFERVNEFRKWKDWSPWAKKDPAAKETFEGPAAGQGAVFRWAGNSEVGEGSMTITESRPSELVRMKLAFVKPYESSCDVEFAFRAEGKGTAVTWSMFGKNDFVGKAMCLFMDMDKMVGGDFEKGLGSIKALVEAEPAK